MKKTALFTALLAIMCTTVHADESITSTTTPAPAVKTPASAAPAATPETTPATPATATPPVEAAPVINCQYHIAADKTNIEESILKTWAEKASVQSFDFSPTTLDAQLDGLKACFTDQGWQGFNDALQQSGNISSIKNQNLTVSSQVDGDIKISSVKENQWKATVPMQIVYQNDKEKMTQLLSVDLLIGRKMSGDLGIMQMIATPRVTAAEKPAEENATAAPAAAPATESAATAEQPKPAEPAAKP